MQQFLKLFLLKQGQVPNYRRAIPLVSVCLSCMVIVMYLLFKSFYMQAELEEDYPEFAGVDDQFSLIIATHFPRKKLIRQQLKRLAYGQCPHLKEIFIYWVDRKNPLPDIEFFGFKPNDGHIPLTIFPTVSGFIVDRFLAPKNLSTDTVLVMDDDLVIKGSELDRAFVIYKKNNYTDRLFGLRTRAYRNEHYHIFEYDRSYNMVITNFVFLNVKMLESYFKPEYKELVDMCVQLRNCDDLLMNYIVQHEYKKSPIAIKLDVIHLGFFGISFGSKHREKRDKCCKAFEKHFGYDVVAAYETNSILMKTW